MLLSIHKNYLDTLNDDSNKINQEIIDFCLKNQITMIIDNIFKNKINLKNYTFLKLAKHKK